MLNTGENKVKNCGYSIPDSCGKKYKNEYKLKEHRKAVVRGETIKLSMTDCVWWESGSHQPLWNGMKILNKEEHWRVRRLRISLVGPALK